MGFMGRAVPIYGLANDDLSGSHDGFVGWGGGLASNVD
jgi:hypothetical protein